MSGPLWRVGTKLGRTLYIGDELVGMMDEAGMAAKIVEAMNDQMRRSWARAEAASKPAPAPPGPTVTLFERVQRLEAFVEELRQGLADPTSGTTRDALDAALDAFDNFGNGKERT